MPPSRARTAKAATTTAASKPKPDNGVESNESGESDGETAVDAKKASKGKKKMNGSEEKAKSTRGRKKADPQEEEALEDVPEPPKTSARGRKKTPAPEEAPEEVEPKRSRGKKKESPKEEDPEDEPPKKIARGRKKADAPENGDAESDDKPVAVKSARGRKKTDPEPSSSEPSKPPPASRGRKKNPSKSESSENDDEAEKLPLKRVRKGKLESLAEANDDDDEEPEKLPAKRTRKPVLKPAPADEDDDEDEKPVKKGRKAAEKKEPKAKAAKPKAKRDEADEGDEEDKEEKEETTSKKSKTDEKKLLNKTETNLDEVDFSCDNTNAKGDKYNIKICSWNVGGIRSILTKKGVEYCIKEDADVLVMQETKCNEQDLPSEWDLPGYKRHYMDSEKSGYAGVALYTKKEPISVKIGLDTAACNDEGRIITAEFEGFYLINVYVPNAGKALVNLPKRLEWNEVFMKYVKELDEKKPVIITGDLNVSHQEIDLANPKSNKKNAGFTKEERDGMTDLLAAGFVDTFRQLYPDQVGAYTYWTYLKECRSRNVGWRLDYFLVSERIKDHVCDNVMRTNVYGSDHCPIVLYANL